MPTCPKCNYIFQVKGRSNPQNSYYWGVVVKTLADELGYTSDEMHDIIKSHFLSCTEAIPGRRGAVYVQRVTSTSSLSTVEFEELMARIRQWASIELGINIQEPNEPTGEES